MTTLRVTDWSQLIGTFVEIWRNHKLIREGYVDNAMADSTVIWIAADTTHGRLLYEASAGYEVWVEPRELEGTLRYRMTVTALQHQL